MIKEPGGYLTPAHIHATDPLVPPVQARIDAWASRAAVTAPVLAGLIALGITAVRIAVVA